MGRIREVERLGPEFEQVTFGNREFAEDAGVNIDGSGLCVAKTL